MEKHSALSQGTVGDGISGHNALNYHTHLITFACDFPGAVILPGMISWDGWGVFAWKWFVLRTARPT